MPSLCPAGPHVCRTTWECKHERTFPRHDELGRSRSATKGKGACLKCKRECEASNATLQTGKEPASGGHGRCLSA